MAEADTNTKPASTPNDNQAKGSSTAPGTQGGPGRGRGPGGQGRGPGGPGRGPGGQSRGPGGPGGRGRGQGGPGGRGRGRRDRKQDDKAAPKEEQDLVEKVVFINRCAKVVKGGRRFSFSALVVSGDQKGRVGVGFGKANEVSEAIRKASETAKRSLEPVALRDGTVPHEAFGVHGGGRVLLRPASEGTGLIAGGGVRAVVEAAGINDILAKSLGSNNPANVVKATIAALRLMRDKKEIFTLRGKPVPENPAKRDDSPVEEAKPKAEAKTADEKPTKGKTSDNKTKTEAKADDKAE